MKRKYPFQTWMQWHGAASACPERRGTTIIVVLALMSMLMVLGFVFFTLASEERVNSENFAEAAKVGVPVTNDFFEYTLRQIILGARHDEKASPLSTGQHSLMATLFGPDSQPFSGQGINLVWDTTGTTPVIAVDQNFNGIPEVSNAPAPPGTESPNRNYLLNINGSWAASGNPNSSALTDLSLIGPGNLISYPNPDVPYTYPDINNAYLAYDTELPNGVGGTIRIIAPSYLRPQILRDLIDPNSGLPISEDDWYSSEATVSRILRPHKLHKAITTDGRRSSINRFISENNDPTLDFPFDPPKVGVWTNKAAATPTDQGTYEFDADPDGDGIKDAIWMDLGFPMLKLADGSNTEYVPLVAIKIVDADALFNLNAHGNLAARFEPGAVSLTGQPFGGVTNGLTNYLSRSNHGLNPSGVNPQRGLYADPGTATPAEKEQHNNYFGHFPGNARELANMEWWWMLTGRPEFDSGGSPVKLLPGRFGEEQKMVDAWTSRNVFQMPGPGATFFGNPSNPPSPPSQPYLIADDNHNLHEGRTFGHPVDYRGNGRFVQQANRKLRSLATFGKHKWPGYHNYFGHPDTIYNNHQSNALMPGFTPGYLVDEPTESILEAIVKKNSDEIYGPEENVALQLADADLNAVNFSSRVQNLAPVNFDTSDESEEIRKQYTTLSYDLKSFGREFNGSVLRAWENNADSDGDGRVEFPPQFGGTAGTVSDPFRAEIRELLTMEAADKAIRKLQRRLSITGVLERSLPPQSDGTPNPSARLRFRSLTPHPANLPNTPIPQVLNAHGNPLTHPNETQQAPATAQQKDEYLARRDRQIMARDIYVLMYTLCGGNDATNYSADNSAGAIYSSTPAPNILDVNARGDELRVMAQFAVNMVDALDPDNVITFFEYDTNLADGWDLDDNPYTNTLAEQNSADRQVVSGVEEQRLTINEAMFTLAKKVTNAASAPHNHPATEYNDEQHRDFSYIELQNVSPSVVNFNNDAWQLVVIPFSSGNGADGQPGDAGVDDDRNGRMDDNSERGWTGTDDSTTAGEERRLTLRQAAGSVGSGAGSRFTIGTAGDKDDVDPMGNIRPSNFMVDPLYRNPPLDPMNPINPIKIAPRGTLNLDLMTAGQVYRINNASTSGTKRPDGLPAGDGFEHPNTTNTDPAGQHLLQLLQKDSILGSGDVSVRVELRRRANLDRAAPDPTSAMSANHASQSADNPWITVDTSIVPLRVFTLQESDQAPEIQTQLKQVISRERQQPLLATVVRDYLTNAADPNNALTHRFNSLGQENNYTITPSYPLWHPHFNRDYTSVADLFNTPLYGPQHLTRQLGDRNSPSRFQELDTAGSRFLNPLLPIAVTDYTDLNQAQAGTANTPQDRDNRWHRLLEFVEVPTRALRHYDNPWYTVDTGKFPTNGNSEPDLNAYRQQGRINLNTLRHPAVLAGLVDDQLVGSLNFDPNQAPKRVPIGLSDTDNRNWWNEFLVARDGIDPFSFGRLNTGLLPPVRPRYLLPGLPGSRPFRSLDFSRRGTNSLDDTILRSLPADSAVQNQRRLFEVGTKTEHDNQTIDHAARNRLLAKVMNNSTTRSNVFFVFIQVDFFEATEVTDGSLPAPDNEVVRIGPKLPNSPAMRGFFVVDRSQGASLIQPRYIPRVWKDQQGTDRFTFSFYNYNRNQNTHNPMDYQPMILHREIINQ